MEGLFNPQQWNHLHKHLSEMGLASSLLSWSNSLCTCGPFPLSTPATLSGCDY